MLLNGLTKLRARLGTGVLSRALFSLVLAFLLWGWVTSQDDPEIDRVFAALTPAVAGQSGDLVVIDEGRLPTVTVTLRGPRSLLNDLSPASLHVAIDLSEVKAPGTVEVPIAVTAPRGVRIISTSPARIAVPLDRLTSKAFPLDIDKGPAIPPYSIGAVDTPTKRVDVRGPASVVDRVVRVVLPVGLGDRRDAFEAQFTPEARDAAGARVAGVAIDPSSVTATVAVDRVGRTVSIVPNIQGEPADGYRVTGTSVGPPTITVDGPADTLAQMIVVSTVPIDVTGRRAPFSLYDVPLTLPAGTRLVDRTSINVEVKIEAEQQQQQVGGVRVTTSGLDPGLRATITPPEIAITLSGSRERLRQLQGSDIQVEVDLRGRGPGTYTIVPTVTVPADLRYEPPPAVRVQIDRLATPTPVPTVAPTPRPTPAPSVPPPAVTPTVGREGDRPGMSGG